jgi:hypothetical protein
MKSTIACLIVGIIPSLCLAQNTFNSAGSSNIINGQVHEYSIGELSIISTNSNNAVTVTHGLLQPTLLVEPLNSEVKAGLSSFNVYPNPTNGIIFIKSNDINVGEVALTVLDAKGATLYNHNFVNSGNEVISVNLSTYAEGTYLIVLKYDNSSTPATFRIIKSQ